MMEDHGPTFAAGGLARPRKDRCGRSLSFGTGTSPGFDRFGLPGRLPVPWEQRLEFVPFGAPGYDAFQYIGEPGQWFDAVQFRALDERRNDRPMPSAAVISREKCILRVIVTGRMARSTVLVSSSSRPSSRNKIKPLQWFIA